MEETEFNVAECLKRVRDLDQSAARALVEHLYPAVIKIVRSHMPRRGAEEDLAQEIFVKMFNNLNQYQGVVPIRHWVSRIAVNHCLSAIQAQKSRPEWRMADLSEAQSEALEAVTSNSSEDSHPLHETGARELVERLLEPLSPGDRLVMRMLEMEDRSIEEIKELTGWSATMIRVRAFRARKKLNRLFGHLRKAGKL